jgi:PelA/Pel-15E family pectate lyase
MMSSILRRPLCLAALALAPIAPAANSSTVPSRQVLQLNAGDHSDWIHLATAMPDAWYGSAEARAIAETVLKYQTNIGGWAKNTGYQDESRIKQDEWARIQQTGIGATFDNGSTLTEMRFLARVYARTGDQRCREAFLRGVAYILKAQYPNGGWPQYYPYRRNKSAYSSHITYNDDVMVNVMRFVDSIAKQAPEYAPLELGEEARAQARRAFDQGVECILRTQIRVDGQPTVWCAQHDETTLQPAGARSYELPSFSGGESAGVVILLMDIEQPSPEIINPVRGAVKWFQAHKIEGIRVDTLRNAEGERDRIVVADRSAPALWARFYDLETGKPFFCDVDGVKKATLAELGLNRRGGYSWYSTAPARVLERYPAWGSEIALETSPPPIR